jgi:putative Mg2+ transporter-C (MgtC) family protein
VDAALMLAAGGGQSWLGDLLGGFPEDIVRILLAIAVGGVIGAEREFRDKSAGFRTMIFICVGAALFTMFSEKLALAAGQDTTRISANIVSGIGFLGAGVILREGGRITGLTSAATIWLTAALGMGIGAGLYLFVISATAAVLAVLWLFPWLERWIEVARETRTYELVCPMSRATFRRLDQIFVDVGLKVRGRKEMKRGGDMICVFGAMGSIRNHDRLVERLLSDPEVKELRF